MKRRKSKAQKCLVTQRIVYASPKCPSGQHQELTVDVRRGTIIDMDYAAALVAARTPLPLRDVIVVRIEAY
jgi:hypothetical protein